MNKILPPRIKTFERSRQSNLELFRIIAMFLVLVVHANYFSLQAPTAADFADAPLPATTRVFFESLSIGCVNMFVLLSGWFGIHPKFRSFFNFIFQCLFFLCGIYLFCLVIGWTTLSVEGIAGCFVLLKWNWFIKAYIGLYILAPVLNVFVEKTGEKELRWFLISFYLFQTIYSWCSGAAEFFLSGYSTMSFIGLYMLARYVRLYPNKLTKQSQWSDLSVFFGLVALQTMLISMVTYIDIPLLSGRLINYINPIVIIEAIYLLLFFSKISFQSNLVNFIGASSFAVFLLHTNPNLCRPYFIPFVQNIYEQYEGVTCLGVMLLFLLVVFITAIVIDQIRLFCWKRIWTRYENRL